MQDAVTAVREIAEAPAELLGSSLRQHELMTVRELHGAAISATKSAWQYQQDYEAVGTQVRTDLGDSIKKCVCGYSDYAAGRWGWRAHRRMKSSTHSWL